MNEFSGKHLADGLVPSTKTTVYTVPAGKLVILTSIILVNNHTSDVVVNAYVNFGVTSRSFLPKDMSMSSGWMIDEDFSIMLETGHFIELHASIDAVISYIISGAIQE